jgi:hypothetical protein
MIEKKDLTEEIEAQKMRILEHLKNAVKRHQAQAGKKECAR